MVGVSRLARLCCTRARSPNGHPEGWRGAMNLALVAPEMVLLVSACVLLLLDLTGRRPGLAAGLTLCGLLVAGAAAVPLVGARGTAFGGMVVADDFALVFKALFLGSTLVVVLFSWEYVERLPRLAGEYYALLLLACAGTMLLAGSGELITLYLSLEVTTISLAALAALLKDERSTEAGIKYLLLGGLSSAVLLYGMAIVLALAGTTNLQEIGAMLPGAWQENRLAVLLAMVLFTGGFGFKLAMVPFQMWAPDVYEGAPTPVTAFLSVVSKAGGVAVVLRVFHSALGSDPIAADWATVFAVLSALSMTLGNAVAIQQRNIKRMMGYSSIAHAGYLLVGIAVVPQVGPGGAVFYLLAYALTNLGAFAAITVLGHRLNSDLIADYSGAWERSPLAALALGLCLLSLTGIPPTAGFFAKLFIFNAGMQHGLGWLVLIGVVNSVVSAYYYVGVLRVVFLGLPSSDRGFQPSLPATVAIGIAAAGTVLLGVFPGPALDVATVAASSVVP